jgi:hypothetical protein
VALKLLSAAEVMEVELVVIEAGQMVLEAELVVMEAGLEVM